MLKNYLFVLCCSSLLITSTQAWCQDNSAGATSEPEAIKLQTGQVKAVCSPAPEMKNLPVFRKSDVFPIAVAFIPDVGIIGYLGILSYREHKVNQAVKHWLLRNHPEVASSINSREPFILQVEANAYASRDRPYPGKIFGLAESLVSINQLSSNLATGRYKVLVDTAPVDLSNDGSTIRDFVAGGGYFLLTGANSMMLWQLFPGLIDPSPLTLEQDKLVDAEIAEPIHTLTRELPKKSSWWLPRNSATLQIVAPETVSPLVLSEGVRSQTPEGSGVIAATFPYGKGHVLCISGSILPSNSLGSNSPDLVKGAKIAAREELIANFIAAALGGTDCVATQKAQITESPDRL
jgi:hypothetical protein